MSVAVDGRSTGGELAPLRAIVIGLGAVIGVIDVAGVGELALGLVCAVIGGALVFAFRRDPGPATRQWQRYRRAAPDAVLWLYGHVGPWLWRFGVGLLCGCAGRGIV